MSYIRDQEKYERSVERLLRLRIELIESVNLNRISMMPEPEKTRLLKKIWVQDQRHWTELVKYLMLPKSERKRILKRLYEKDPDLKLPPTKFSILLEISELSDSERKTYLDEFNQVVKDLSDSIDLEKVRKTIMKKNPSLKCSLGLIAEAVRKTCEHLNRPTRNFHYFFSWLKAEVSQELKKTIIQADVKTKTVISLDDEYLDSDTTLHEKIGEEDEVFSIIEEAERALVVSEAFVEYLKSRPEFGIDTEDFEKVLEEARACFERGEFRRCRDIFDSDFYQVLREKAEKELKKLLRESRKDENEARRILSEKAEEYPLLSSLNRIRNSI